MPPTLSQGSMLWESLPWEAVLRASCPKQRAQGLVVQKVQRAFRSTRRPKDKNGRFLPELTTKRREMRDWLAGPGKRFEQALPDSTNYLTAYDEYGNLIRASKTYQTALLSRESEIGLSDQERERRADLRRRNTSDVTDLPRERPDDLRPFPQNRFFVSERVLSEELRNIVHQRVQELNGDIAAVSAAYSIDMRRVAAVVRLKTIEDRWVSEGRKLAKPYNNAVLGMLPQTAAPRNGVPQAHEGINDLPVHVATRNQVFYPASESRQFTRADASKAFAQELLPADARINHPKLIEIEKWALEGMDQQTRRAKVREVAEQEKARKESAEARRLAREAEVTRVVEGKRWDFKFRDTSVELVGRDGRSHKGVGTRYGMPHDDRKRGQYKLPRSVE